MKVKLLKGVKYTFAIALVVVSLALAYLITPIFGNKVLIVRSGSMAPTLPVGSLVVVRPNSEVLSPLPVAPLYSPGDVLSYKDSRNPNVVTTHRVVSYKIDNNQVLYETKGDANNEADQVLVAEKNILGSSWLTLPYLGILFAFAKTKIGFFLMVLIPAMIVILMESWNIIKEIRKKKPLRYHYIKGFKEHVTLSAFIPFLSLAFVFSQTFAYFSDSATSTGNIFAAGQFAPTIDDIVINEVYYRITTNHRINNSEADSEWAELYNPTSGSVSLANWSISDNNSCDNMPNASIPPGGFAVVSPHTEAAFRAVWTTIPAGVVFITAPSSIGNGLANNDELALRNGVCPGGTIVDHISWGSNTNGLNPSIPMTANGVSSERSPDGTDTNTNADFVSSNPPTPGQ